MRNHNRLYTLLNVLPDADPVVIEAAYKALMKRYHPDIHSGGVAVGERMAAELNHAYRTLRDPDRRADYDAEERAREERRRAELARAFTPPPNRAPPPPPRPEPGRAGKRAAAWIGGAGIAALGGAIYLLAQVAQVPAPPSARPGADTSERSTAATERAFRDQPVNRGQVESAVADFRDVAAASGLTGAAAYSEHCFAGQLQSPQIAQFDRCVAFDHVASRIDLRPEAQAQAPQQARFQPQSLVARHIRAAERFARDPSLIEARLFEIRRLTDGILNQPAAAVPARARAAPPAAPKVVRVASRPTAAPLQARPQPRPVNPVSRPRAAEPDFLERQGGIY
jgi:curved DNA-binding protein CbpA